MKLTQQLHRVHLPKLCVILLLVTAVISCQKELHFDKEPEKDHNLILKFKPVVQYDSVPLVFGKEYPNPYKEYFTPTAFKFYIHKIELANTDSGTMFPLKNDKYYLIDFADSASTEVKIAVYPFVYNRIYVTIGVDSAQNVSGAKTGALDPALGMFSESTGYFAAKLEGTSRKSSQGGRFEFHIGGYKGTEKVSQTVEWLFPYPQHLDLKAGSTSEIFINCDAYKWFHQPWEIKIANSPIINTPGELATHVAENYSKMMSIDSVANE